MTDQCIVHFDLSVAGDLDDPMGVLENEAATLLNSLDPRCEWNLKWEIHPEYYASGVVARWYAKVTARMATRPVPPDDPRPPRPRPPRDR